MSSNQRYQPKKQYVAKGQPGDAPQGDQPKFQPKERREEQALQQDWRAKPNEDSQPMQTQSQSFQPPK